MSKQKFSDKYAPRNKAEILGNMQNKACEILIRDEPQIVFFTGFSGSGKTTTGKIYASHLLNCGVVELKDHWNYNYISSKSMKLGDWEALVANFRYASIGKTVYFVDETDKMTNDSQKLLNDWFEDNNLPDDVYFIFATLEPHNPRFNKDFKDRLKPHFHFTAPSEKELKDRMVDIFKAENVELEGLYTLTDPIRTVTGYEANSILSKAGGSVRVLMDTIQEFVDGYFIIDDSLDDSQVLNLLLDGETNINIIFNSLKQYMNFNEVCDAICRDSLNGITYGKLVGEQQDNARRILQFFGNGLSKNSDPKIGFHKLIIDFLDTI